MYMLSFNLIGEALSELPEVNGLNFPIAGFSRSVEASSQADFYWTSLETPGVNMLNRFSNQFTNQFINHFQEVGWSQFQSSLGTHTMHVDAKYVNLDYDFTAPPPSLLFPSQTNGYPKHSVLTAAQLSTVSQTTTKQPPSPPQPCWLCSEREKWFKRQSCLPQWHVGQS